MATNQTSITVSRVIDASTKDIFNVLTLPSRHREFDGSGMVRADEKAQRIQAVGDVFVMNMQNERFGDYRVHNHVSAFAENKLVGWRPNTEDRADTPGKWEWLYELEAINAGSTKVTLTYDWSDETDETMLASFPAVSEEELEESLNLLAAAVSG